MPFEELDELFIFDKSLNSFAFIKWWVLTNKNQPVFNEKEVELFVEKSQFLRFVFVLIFCILRVY
jgi:hypothetical protein